MSALAAIRRNHALEHATLTILSERLGHTTRMVGYSVPAGFFVFGNVPSNLLTDAADEALARLQKGESELAVAKHCGTNTAVTGLLAMLAFSATAIGRAGRPMVPAFAAAGAALAARPMGPVLQKYVTTDANVAGVSIARVLKTGRGGWTVHRVDINQPNAAR